MKQNDSSTIYNIQENPANANVSARQRCWPYRNGFWHDSHSRSF